MARARRILVPPLPPAAPLGRPAGPVRTLAGATMGTTWSVRLPAPPGFDEARLAARIGARLDRIVAEMSTWEPGSAISRFNAAAPGAAIRLPEDLRRVLAAALSLAAASGGAFDPTIGPAVDLWGFGPGGGPGRVPGPDEIAAVLARIGWDRLRLAGEGAVQPGGLSLDLSGIAKGFAVDAVADDLLALGHRDVLVEIGGEFRGQGAKPDGLPWWVALERPPGAEALPETVVALHGLALATSGDYRRRFEAEGAVHAHTIDPRTARPADRGVASVSVVARTCMEADALATAITVLGPAEGLAFAAGRGVAALMVVRGPEGFAEHLTPAFRVLADEPA